MLFKQELVANVLADRKRPTVRLNCPRVSVGHSYAVQTSFYSLSIERITVTDMLTYTLGGLTQRDVDLEGWKNRPRQEFEQYFAEVNHFELEMMSAAAWKKLRARPIWCVEFKPECTAAGRAKTKLAKKAAKKVAKRPAHKTAKEAAAKKTTRGR